MTEGWIRTIVGTGWIPAGACAREACPRENGERVRGQGLGSSHLPEPVPE